MLNNEKQVRTFRTQAEEQEKTLQAQEAEVFAKKQELTDLKSEELRTEQQMQSTTTQLDKLTTTLQVTQQQISQIKGWYKYLIVKSLKRVKMVLCSNCSAYSGSPGTSRSNERSSGRLR